MKFTTTTTEAREAETVRQGAIGNTSINVYEKASRTIVQFMAQYSSERDGDIARAEQTYRTAIRTTAFPDPRLLFDWGVALERLGKPSEALDAYRRAVLLDPADALIQSRLARLVTAQR